MGIGARGFGIGAVGFGAGGFRGFCVLRCPFAPQVAPPDDPPLSSLSPLSSASSMGGNGRADGAGELEEMPFLVEIESVRESKVRHLYPRDMSELWMKKPETLMEICAMVSVLSFLRNFRYLNMT